MLRLGLGTVSLGILAGLRRVLRRSCAGGQSGCHLGNSQRREHKTEGNAGSAAEHQTPLTISTGPISPANRQHKSDDFFTPDQRWRTAFESSAIGITMADLDGHHLPANTVFQNMVGYTEAELQEFSFFDIPYEEDREAKLKLVGEPVERRRAQRARRLPPAIRGTIDSDPMGEA